MNAERPTLEPQEFNEVLACYSIGLLLSHQEFPRGSHDTAKVLVKTDTGRYMLKRSRYPDGGTDALEFSHRLQTYLATQFFPLPHIIGTSVGSRSLLRRGDYIYEMFEFIPGEGFNHKPETAEKSGSILAQFHNIVQDIDVPPELANRGLGYHDSADVRGKMLSIAERLHELPGSPEAQRSGQAAVASLITQMTAAYETACDDADDHGVAEFAVQITHGDWHPGNVLFQDENIVAVLDFDAARMRPTVMDLANGALQYSIQRGGRDLSGWPAECDVPRLEAFIRGYDRLRQIAMDEAAVIRPLMIESLISEAVRPVAVAGHFAGLDGLVFLRTIMRKVEWLTSVAPSVALSW